jgi:hypothetical protein
MEPTGQFGELVPRTECEDRLQPGAMATPSFGEPSRPQAYGYGVATSPIDYVTSEKIPAYGPAWTYDTQYPMTVAEQRGETQISYQANPSGTSPEISGAGPSIESAPESYDTYEPLSMSAKKKWMGAAAAAALLLAFFMRRR